MSFNFLSSQTEGCPIYTHCNGQTDSTLSNATLGAFFWDYSGKGILGIHGICVLLGAVPFSE